MLNFNIMLLSFPPHSKALTQFNNGSYMAAAMNIRCFNRHFALFSLPLRPVPLPRPIETHLWYVIPDEVKSSSLLEQCLEILSPCEKESVLCLEEDELRKRAILARTLVRTTIARYQTNPYTDPRSLNFKKNSFGKPEVDRQCASEWTRPPLHFNISHTSSLIACGISAHSHIGIDVEEKKRTIKNDVMSFARRFFCPHEVEHLANILDPEKRRQEFIKLWTLKESYVKALGRGFSASPFKTFRISFKASSISVSNYIADSKVSEIIDSTNVPNSKWQFALLELADTHYAAICMEKDTCLEENEESPMTLRVWKTVPFQEDTYMSGTPSVVTVAGLVKQV